MVPSGRVKRWLVATGAVALAAYGEATYADPGSPQVSPVRAAREDAQRLGEQLRDLDREAAPEPGAGPSSWTVEPGRGDPRQADASACLDRGVAAYHAHDLARAIGELVAASRLVPSWPDPYRWLALAEAEAGDCPSAAINVAAFAARVAPGDRRLPELSALRDRCLHTGELHVESAPTGATIRVDDGPPVGTTAQRLTLRAGAHTISVEKPGFEPGSQRVEVDPLAVRYARFALTAERPPPLAQRWWFWAAIGGGIVATILVLNAAHEASQPLGRSAGGLPGVTCDASGCHP
jgi:hypothetical protein